MKAARILAVLVLAVAAAGARESNDVVFMKNGDRITCEVKRLEAGLLYLKASYSTAEFAVDWNLVDHVQSSQPFVVRLSNGQILGAQIASAEAVPGAEEEEETLPIVVDGVTQEVPHRDVVNIRQFGERFYQKFDGGIDYGFSLTKANNQTQSNLHFDVTYGKTRDIVSATGDGLFSRTEGADDTNRNELGFSYDRVFRRRWFGRGLAQFLQSDEQSLDLRSSFGGALGRRVVDSNSWFVQLFAGLVKTNESYFDGETGSHLEMITGVELETFHFDRSNLTVNVYVLPSISQFGRTRANLNLQWHYKVYGNLKYRIGAFNNFDSQPPSGAARNDFGVTTGFGWSF